MRPEGWEDIDPEVARENIRRAVHNSTHPICHHCGNTRFPEYPLMACPGCFEPLFCPWSCGNPDSPHGRHWFHWGGCPWHDGPCEEPIWCPCSYRRENPAEEK